MATRAAVAIVVVLAVIFLVPFVVYSVFSVFAGLEPPTEGSPLSFLLGILISKAGTAVAFVALFTVGRHAFQGRWMLYGLIWLAMVAVGEIGQAVGPGYSWGEAVPGIISEAVYCPLSAYLTWRLVGTKQ